MLSGWYSKYKVESLNSCKRLLEEVGTENPVIIVGTTSQDTPPSKRGMIIGICLLGDTIHETQRVVSEHHALSQKNLRPSNNEFRWPFGVAISCAIQFQEPYLSARAVCPKVFNKGETGKKWGRKPLFKQLSEDESDIVLHKIKFRDATKKSSGSSDQYFQAQPLGSVCGRNGNQTGPQTRSRGPLPTKRGAFLLSRIYEESSTYLFRFSGMDCWKVGITGRLLDIRLSELNKYVPSKILDERIWQQFRAHHWNTKRQAYEMEQKVLDLIELQNFIISGELIYCDQDTICKAWDAAREQLT